MKLTITNFQAHEKTVVEFGPNVTSIVGPSDVGKSAVLRALRWVLLNQPLGDAFVRDGARKAEVEWTDDLHIIRRVRGASVNTYDVDGALLEAFGNDLPAEVARVGNVSNINFQGQHDSPFWFGETAGEVSRQLNRIVNLDVIDTTLRNLSSALRAAQAEQKVYEEMLEEDQLARTNLKYVREMVAEFEVLEGLKTQADELEQVYSRLVSTLKDVSEHTSMCERSTTVAESGQLAVQRMETELALEQRHFRLLQLIQEVLKQRKLSTREVPDLSELEKLKVQAVEAESEWDVLNINLKALNKSREDAQVKEESWRNADLQWKKSKPKECPLCGQQMS